MDRGRTASIAWTVVGRPCQFVGVNDWGEKIEAAVDLCARSLIVFYRSQASAFREWGDVEPGSMMRWFTFVRMWPLVQA